MSEPSEPAEPAELRADCARCAGLCCVVPAFSRSADFAIDKPAGQPCRHLGGDFRCGIHTDLRERGFRGCAVYDCLGAGQQVSQVTFGGQDWADPATAAQMHAVFPVMRQLHELLWHLAAALSLPEAGPVQAELRQARREIGALTRLEAPALLILDPGRPWQQASALLRRASELARAGVGGADHAGADLAGARLGGADLTGASLRGTVLI
ncbi:MAG: pentapeptide repeat-containing protein, partial [Streptosporangiaceae bacterium]